MTQADKAREWVNGYTAGAVGTVVATALVPGAATVILCSLEATMCYQIGMLYRHDWKMSDALATSGMIGLASFAGKIAALEAAILAGPFSFFIKAIIAGGIVKAMGELIIKHFEDSEEIKLLN
ncbi:MAG: hypothetical protein ACKV2Q_14705 [Planctomycetaceae bacterium]